MLRSLEYWDTEFNLIEGFLCKGVISHIGIRHDPCKDRSCTGVGKKGPRDVLD